MPLVVRSREKSDSSTSTVPSQSSYTSAPRLVMTFDENNRPMYGIYEEPPPSTVTGKSNRRFPGFFKWRLLLSPLRSLIDKRTNVVNPHQEKPSLLKRRDDTAIVSQHPEISDASGHSHFLQAWENNPSTENLNASTDKLPSPKFSRPLYSSPVNLGNLRAEVEKRSSVIIPTQPDGDRFPQAASSSPSVESLGGYHSQAPINPSGRCVMAELALQCASSKEAEVRGILADSGYEGSYLIQVGFNQEMLASNQGLLQEIYIFLESKVHPVYAQKIVKTLDPFPVSIYTPDATLHYPLPQDEEAWDLWTHRGIFCSDIGDLKVVETPTTAPSDEDSSPVKQAGTSHNASGTGGQSSNAIMGRNNLGRNGSRGKGSSSGDGDEEDEDQNADDHVSFRVETCASCDHSTREVSIPFASTITLSGGTSQPFTRYNTNACVDIRIEDNLDSLSPPPGMNWGGPWLETKFTLLDAEMHAPPKRKLNYHLELSQIRIMASGCDVSYLAYSPKIIRVDDDDVKSTTEKEGSLGVRATLGPAPNVRVDSSISRTSSEERSQNRWEVTSHRPPSDTNRAGERRKSIMWKYAHNSKYYSPETRNDFEPKPSVTFGLSRASSKIPQVEVEVVMDYSSSSPVSTFRDWFADISKPKKSFPAFSNFLHQVSVEIDLEHVKQRREWVVGLDAEDRYEVPEIDTEVKPISTMLESNTGESDCEVFLRRALHGRVHVTEEQRKGHRSDPLPWPLQTSLPTQDIGDTLMVGGLATPSPSPTSSMINSTRGK